MKGRLEVLSSEKEALKKELESSQALVESERKWLRASRSAVMHDMKVGVRAVTTATYTAQLEVIRNYLEA